MPHSPRLRALLLHLGLAIVLIASAAAKPADWAQEIDALTAADAAHPPPAGAVVFVGSSSIRLWESLAADFPGVPLVQRGFGGSELADSVFYFDRLVRPYHPRLVVLYAGENDLANGKPPAAVAADFDAFRSRLHAALPGIRLLYLSIKPSPSRARLLPGFREANALIAAACARDPLCRFVDVHTTLLTSAGELRPELYKPDQLHLNREGYALWVKVLTPLLQP